MKTIISLALIATSIILLLRAKTHLELNKKYIKLVEESSKKNTYYQMVCVNREIKSATVITFFWVCMELFFIAMYFLNFTWN